MPYKNPNMERECKRRWAQLHREEINLRHRKPNSIFSHFKMISCPVCNEVFKTSWTALRNGKRFCSLQCYSTWRSKNIRGEVHPTWRGGKIALVCKQCHKEFAKFPSDTSHGRSLFCSKSCYSLWCKTLTGPLAARWQGGKTPIHLRVRASEKYQAWRQQVFLRDDFICRQCGQRGGTLEAHHIRCFGTLLDDARRNLPLLELYDAAMIYSPMWDNDNGLTLCVKCHHALKRHGRGAELIAELRAAGIEVREKANLARITGKE